MEDDWCYSGNCFGYVIIIILVDYAEVTVIQDYEEDANGDDD
jgi:hypothetical protein